MRAAIAIDAWKLSIFQRRLSEAGLCYEQWPGVSADTLFLKVETEDLHALVVIVKAANSEAAEAKERKTLEN